MLTNYQEIKFTIMKKTIFFFLIFSTVYSQKIDSLKIKINESMQLAQKEKISQDILLTNQLTNKYQIPIIIDSLESFLKEKPRNSNYYMYSTYQYTLARLLRQKITVKEKHFILNKLLSVCDDSLRQNLDCNNYVSSVISNINFITDHEQVKKVINLLFSPFFDNQIIELLGDNDILEAKDNLIKLKISEIRKNPVNEDRLFKIHKVLARLGDKESIAYCLNFMKDNYRNGDNAIKENYNIASYIAQPEIIDFYIKDLDSKRAIVLEVMSIHDEEKGVGENVKVTVTIAQLAVRILHYLIPEMPKFYTNSNYNKSNVWVPQYKIWLKKNGGKYKINRMNRFNIFEI